MFPVNFKVNIKCCKKQRSGNLKVGYGLSVNDADKIYPVKYKHIKKHKT